jgi:hypothetical protein
MVMFCVTGLPLEVTVTVVEGRAAADVVAITFDVDTTVDVAVTGAGPKTAVNGRGVRAALLATLWYDIVSGPSGISVTRAAQSRPV